MLPDVEKHKKPEIFTASHDLLAPLGSMEASIGLIKEMQGNKPGVAPILTIIRDSVKKFGSLIKNITAVAKIEDQSLSTDR